MQECHLTTTAQHADTVSAQLNLLGALAITWLDAGDQPILEPNPDEERLWNHVRLIALFDQPTLAKTIHDYMQTMQENGYVESFSFCDVEDQDWVRASLDQFTPIFFGKRLWICPSWQTPPEPQAINVMFDPGLAFGTGTHPTTALCLEWLAENIKGKETIIDYGCGSGILAIAALKLGAQSATAVDHDAQALTASQNNAGRNDIDKTQLEVCLPDQIKPQQVDILIANIISRPLIDLAPKLIQLTRPSGLLVLSGILADQVDDVIKAYQPLCRLASATPRDGWVRVVLQKIP